MRTKIKVSWVLIGVTLLSGILAYPLLPPVVASHWGLSGQVNGYQSRTFAVLFIPILMTILVLFLGWLPKIDPLGRNIKTFQPAYDRFILYLILFLSYVQILSLIWNSGFRFNIIHLLVPAFGLFIWGLGQTLPAARPNWFFGIRTPWTMSNGRVWYHTHELAGKLYKFAGVLALGGFIWPASAVWFLAVPILAASGILVIFSYLDWRKEN
jgi:uncharacterized membrane protein